MDKVMQTFYHGSNRLFDRFDLSFASEGSGLKFGFGNYVTQKYESAAHYALPRHEKVSENGTYYVYTVEIPDQTEDNHLFSCRPVHPRIVSDASKALGEEIPAEVCGLGKTFRKYIGNKVCGNTGTVRQMSGSADLAAEKAAVEFLRKIGVIMLVWPQSQSNPDGLQNRAYPDSSQLRIVKIERIRLDGKGQLIPGSQDVIKEY